jgi:hypothetical protein
MDEGSAVVLSLAGYSRHSRGLKNDVARSCTWWLLDM